MNPIYDICFLCFEELRSDARTLNLARTYIKNNKKIAIIAPVSQSDILNFELEGIKIYPIPLTKKLRFWRRWIKYHHKARKYKTIKAKIFWANDFYTLYTANKFAQDSKAKLFYDSREIYSSLGPLAQNQFKQSVITDFEKRLIPKVDKIIVSGEMDAEYLKNHFNTDHEYTVIMNLPPYKKRIESYKIREEMNLADDVNILLYQGVLLKGRGIMPVIRALPLMNNTVFCIIGWGPHEQDFRELAKALNVDDRVYFLGKKSYDELFYYTSSADLGIAYIEPLTLSYRLALPNKLFEYCMARIPSLVSNLPAMKNIISEHQIGELIEPGASREDFSNCIKKILNDKDKYVNNCETASKIFCYSAQEQKIIDLLD